MGAEGQRALLLYPPGLQFIAAFFGCLYAKVIAIPFYHHGLQQQHRQRLAALQAVVADARATMLLTTHSFLDEVKSQTDYATQFHNLRWIATDSSTIDLAENWANPSVAGNEIAYLQYTSGSTGMPKGVIVSHANVMHNVAYIDHDFQHTADSVAVSWLPHFHDMGLIYGIIQPLYSGFPCFLMSPLAFIRQPVRWLDAISRYRATHSGGPNFAYDLCVRKITSEERKNLDLASWSVAFNGAEPVREETLKRFAETFKPSGFRYNALYPAYGLAEATLKVTGDARGNGPVVCTCDAESLEQDRFLEAPGRGQMSRSVVGCGHASLNTRVIIVHPVSLRPCAAQDVGEIWVSGPSVALGYWDRPEETKQIFHARLSNSGVDTFLRTGDLGFVHDGNLFVTGRLKDLIVIRGCNYYPSDIELTVEHCHPGFRAGGGAAFTINVHDEERLVVVQELRRSYKNADTNQISDMLRRAVAEHHGLHVHAVVLVKSGSVPKTSSGKIRRKACREKFLRGDLHVMFSSTLADYDEVSGQKSFACETLPRMEREKRRTYIERKLLERIAQVIKRRPSYLNPELPLLNLGLDSLMATELLNEIEAEFGVNVPLANFGQDLTLNQLGDKILDQLMPTAPSQGAHLNPTDERKPPLRSLPISRIRRDGALPLSFEQERFWLLDQVNPQNPTYNITASILLAGQLTLSTLERSLNEIISRHEALRTSFMVREGRPVQCISTSVRSLLPVVDLRQCIEAKRRAMVMQLIREHSLCPFDLRHSPLINFLLLHVEETTHVLVFTIHHIVSDVWSTIILAKELTALYEFFSAAGKHAALPELSIQYVDFASWQRQWLDDKALNSQLSYWRTKLAGALPVKLPADRPRPEIQSFRGAQEVFEIPVSLSLSLREISLKEGVTLFVTLLAAFKAVLYCHSGQEDITVGTPIGGRTRAGTEDLIGLFAYPLILRTDMSGNPTFRQLLSSVRQTVREALEHQDAPLAKVIEVLNPKRKGSYTPLFQAMLNFVKLPTNDSTVSSLKFSPVEVHGGLTDFDLFLTITDGAGGLLGTLVYRVDLFDASTVQRLIKFYLEVLERCAENTEIRLSELSSKLQTPRAEATKEYKQETTIAITSTFSADPVQQSLAFWMQYLNIPAKIELAPYNQIFQQLLGCSSTLAKNHHGINVVLLRFEDWQRYDKTTDLAAPLVSGVREKTEGNVRDLILALKSSAQRCSVPHLICLCPASPAIVGDTESRTCFGQMESLIASELDRVVGVHMITTSELASLYPVSQYYDAGSDELGHIPFTSRFFASLGTMIARKIYALRSPPYKVIVLDCDQTLWKGVCGEGGAEDVKLDAPRKSLQEFMVAQHAAGMLLCLCSKNNEEDVADVFERYPEMPLSRDHICAQRVNWRPKSENIRSLARQLKLELNSFIFIDDDQFECAEVEANCPEVLTLQLPQDVRDVRRFLDHVWAFDHVKITDEDRQRTAFCKRDLERGQFREASLSLNQFLEGLRLEVGISNLADHQFSRAAQLTQRTNQFNVTTIRRSESKIQELCRSKQCECLAVEVRDRFGDYGLVGLIIFGISAETVVVDTFLLSCRAMGRGVEHRMLAKLGEIAKERGIDHVDIPYFPTSKNRPAFEFLNDIARGSRRVYLGGWMFRFPCEFSAALMHSPGVRGTTPDNYTCL